MSSAIIFFLVLAGIALFPFVMDDLLMQTEYYKKANELCMAKSRELGRATQRYELNLRRIMRGEPPLDTWGLIKDACEFNERKARGEVKCLHGINYDPYRDMVIPPEEQMRILKRLDLWPTHTEEELGMKIPYFPAWDDRRLIENRMGFVEWADSHGRPELPTRLERPNTAKKSGTDV